MKNYFLLIIVFLGFNFNANAQLPGTLNTAFSQDGWDDTVYGNNNGFEIKKTLIQPDGKILACAEGYFPSEATQAVIVRYNTDGTFDTTFGGGDGVVRSKDDASIDLWTRAFGMGIQSNGKIIIAGDVFTIEGRIFRLNADGSLDTSFGIDGVINRPRPNAEIVYHVGIQSDDKIIICGEESRLVNGVFAPHVFLWRFTANGVLDSSFGISGVVSYNSADWINFAASVIINDLIILPDNKILINQSFNRTTNKSVMLKKLNANGSVDTSFATNGAFVKDEFDNNSSSYNYSSSAVQENGSIISSITTASEASQDDTQSIFRINAQGEMDTTFNVNLGNPVSNTEFVQLLTSGNKIYVIKKLDQTGLSYEQIFCYDLNGNLVPTFAENGIAIINQNNIPVSYRGKAAISPNGNIYLVSSIRDPNNSSNSLFFASNVIGFNPALASNNFDFANQVVVYPNPTTGIISISNTEDFPIEKIEIMDLSGKIIAEKSTNTSQIDISEFANGIYILTISNGNNTYSQKIIKQ